MDYCQNDFKPCPSDVFIIRKVLVPTTIVFLRCALFCSPWLFWHPSQRGIHRRHPEKRRSRTTNATRQPLPESSSALRRGFSTKPKSTWTCRWRFVIMVAMIRSLCKLPGCICTCQVCLKQSPRFCLNRSLSFRGEGGCCTHVW